MTSPVYIEDIYIEFYRLANADWTFDFDKDESAAMNFYNLLSQGSSITENQSRYILKILLKNKVFAIKLGIDYSDSLKDPKWKQPFRVLDQSKKIWVEQNDEGTIHIAIKMPYSLKEPLEKLISQSEHSYYGNSWDRERAVRLIPLYNTNIIAISDFAEKNRFEIDDSFLEALSYAEELWNQPEAIVPHSKIIDDTVTLVNAPEDTKNWWKEHSVGQIDRDMFLAKSIGYRYFSDRISNSLIEKIANSEHRQFWIKTNERFFELYKKVGGPVAVIVSKSDLTSNDYVKSFVNDAEKSGIDKKDIRVCYRLSKEEDQGFNQWIKENDLGGKVDTGKIFIFQSKPPKWLFSDEISVKIILTNSCHPLPSSLAQSWMNSHPCVCFVGDLKVSTQKEHTIVDL